MVAFNLTDSSLSSFILNGIPGMEAAHIWISIPFSMFYIINLLGNFMVIFVVTKEQALHKPMYLLLCMLALTEIGASTCVVPKALCIFWFGFKGITLNGCLTQMLFFHIFLCIHSSVLVIMAFDRYVAICDPLRYATILTKAQIAKLGIMGLIRAILLILPLPLCLWNQPFCGSHVIHQTYCEHMALMKLLCVDVTVSQTYVLVVSVIVIGLDLTLIGLSYGLILKALLTMSSIKAHEKALNTCTAHICVILISYTPFLFSILLHRFGEGIAAHIHILLANLYLLIPPMLNSIIYGVKTKELREKVRKYTCRGRSPMANYFKPP